MKIGLLTWLGLGLSALAAFALSVAHLALSRFSKIGLSGYLESRSHPDRAGLLERFDDLKTAVEFCRVVLILAFFIYSAVVFPSLRLSPLWYFLGAVVVYAVVFDILPRILASAKDEAVLKLALAARGLLLGLAAPLLVVGRWLCAREERAEPPDAEREASDGEIETFLDEAQEEGIIAKDEEELVRNVVAFGDTVVREVMTPRIDMVCIKRDANLRTLRNLIITMKYSRIPVYKDRLDNIDGVVLAKDLLAYSEYEFDAAPIEPLVRPVLFVPESMKVSDLLDEFQKVKQKLAIVVDEHGGVTGLVTMEDVVEEIVGEIHDEYDTEEAQIVQHTPTEYTVSGEVKVEEVEDLFDEELAEDDFITVGGFVVHHLGRFPYKGERVVLKGLEVEVLDTDGKRVKTMRIRKHAPSEKS
ncbi:MAG: HlyC/CorC family transporter [Candidatus Aminicenantes bacterium]|nr:HlyC/CorC family transporter [Candidatus Aminicenantes bacterium]